MSKLIQVIKVYDDRREYYNDRDELHREDGPAIECSNGNKYWYINGKQHREDGPAKEWDGGGKSWWVNDKLHRLDGPAVIDSDGNKIWFIDGLLYTEEEFHKKIKEMNKKNIIIDGKEFSEDTIKLALKNYINN